MINGTFIIVQARLGSSRFPGKTLKMLGHRTVLAHVLTRCGEMAGMQQVCCAIPDSNADDPLAQEAARCGALVYRGSQNDVLQRYYLAATHIGAKRILRVTSDCPFIDPDVCMQVLGLQEHSGADYVCNNMPYAWPHGLDCEAFTYAALERANNEARSGEEREHVTPFLRNSDDVTRENLPGPGGFAARQRWTLDYPEDLAFLRAVYARLPKMVSSSRWHDIFAVIEKAPELMEINAQHNSRW